MLPNTKLYATAGSWLEQRALDQLATVSALAEVFQTCAFPDLHPGKGIPICVAVATRKIIYPHIVGNDIGCGMALFATDIETRSFKMDRVWRQFDRYPTFADIPIGGVRAIDQLDPALGTIGGGNHFAELTTIESIEEAGVLAQLGLTTGQLCILVHTGSRGMGDAILRQAITQFQAQQGLDVDSQGAAWYVREHDRALSWAAENRAQVAQRCLAAIGVKDSSRLVVDLVHNGLEQYLLSGKSAWVHRKGAAKADTGPVIIPGSRGSHSYLVQSLKADENSLFSLAHGAGRKWQRSATAGKLGARYTISSIRHTRLGSHVFCRDRSLLFEEAPEAYKNIDRVIADLVHFGLVRVIARFRPVLTVKD